MERDFRKGHIEIDFHCEPFTSPARVLMRTLRLFAAKFAFLATVTLAIFLPGKLALQFVCYAADVPMGGLLAYGLLEASDLILGALAVPAIVYGLVEHLRSGRTPAIGECLRWGRRQWGKTLWNRFKVEITVMLWGALLVVPGVIAMVRLIFTDTVVAIEADREDDPMTRSRTLTQGLRWRIFLVLAPMMLIDMAATFLILDRIPGATNSRILFAAADSVLNLFAQLATVAVLLVYLGLIPPGRKSQSHIRAA
jgi:hypothetical protein